MISIADKKFRGRDKIVQKMTKDGLADENLRTGEQKSATAEEKPEQEDSAKETAEKETDEEPVVDEEICMDAEDGKEETPRHHSTACADTARCTAAVCRGACTEQFGAVAVGQVIGIVPPGLLLVHILPRDGVEAFIFQQDVEDFVFILHFFLIGIGFHADVSKSVNRWPNPYSGFHASANLNGFPHFQEILLLEQFLDNRFDLSSGELLINCRQMRNQLIRVMPDLVKLIAVFIITRMGGLHLPNLLIQFFFQFQIILFCTFHVGILAGVGRSHKGTACSLNRCTTA